MATLVIEAADRLGLPVQQRSLRVDELRNAAEIGIASTRRLLHQVSRLDGRSPSGGPWMARLFASMLDSLAGPADPAPSST